MPPSLTFLSIAGSCAAIRTTAELVDEKSRKLIAELLQTLTDLTVRVNLNAGRPPTMPDPEPDRTSAAADVG